jgi:hypothetical protein
MSFQVSTYIFAGSPFIPAIDEDIANKIGHEISQFNPKEMPPQLTVAMNLKQVPMMHVASLLGQINELNSKFGTTLQTLANYIPGFDAPLSKMLLGATPTSLREEKAMAHICPPSNNAFMQSLNEHLGRNIAIYRSLMNQDASGRLIFLHEEDHPFSTDTYYQIGVHAAKYTYVLYMGLVGLF